MKTTDGAKPQEDDMTFVRKLRPMAVWKQFDNILAYPRGSKNETAIRHHIGNVADRLGLPYETDKIGNLVVRKPASSGHDNASITILQAHLDMVNEKNSDVKHDFDRDPIQPVRDGEYLKANGTTLGADNGIGVAAMLAIMEATDLIHGPLELLFTVDEESGLTGASKLALDLHGRQLLNLDSEDEGELTIGCAGGADTRIRLPLVTTDAHSDMVAWQIRLFGLKGGHSGVDIHLQRGNACKLLNRALFALSLDKPFCLTELRGGDKHNAIPREAFATVTLPAGANDAFRAALEAQLAAIREEFKPAEPSLDWEIMAADIPAQVWVKTTGTVVMNLVNALPHGVMAMSYDIEGLVETSTNLATVAARNDELEILLCSRSSVASALTALRQRIRSIAALAWADVEEDEGYPGWKPNMGSKLLAVVRRVHEQVLYQGPKVGAVHAGLECGIIGEKFRDMDMISFGPTIEFPHSPSERVKIVTVGRFYRLLIAVLEELSKR